jgi:hypothetical protein
LNLDRKEYGIHFEIPNGERFEIQAAMVLHGPDSGIISAK